MEDTMLHHRFVHWALTALICSSGTALAHEWPDFNELITKASPAVVRIDTSQELEGVADLSPSEQSLPDTYHDFFEHRSGESPETRATGSGFIISKDGYVLTNQHVVSGASQISVKLIDYRVFDAKVVGMDARSDLALLKIDARNLPMLTFEDPEKVKVGQWVIAIGAPFGLDFSASAGIISAIGRSIPTEGGDNYVPFIQSDVATNPGSSGGPLLNLAGKVAGVNSQIFSKPGGGSIGLSFAIPAGIATEVIRQLKSKGRVARGWLGVYVQDVDKALAISAGLDHTLGALVAQVEPGSPADKADIKPGDIILSLNDRKIIDSGTLPQVVGLLMPGDRVSAEIVRDTARRRVKITLGELPDTTATAKPE